MNKVLNYVDFAVVFFFVLTFIVVSTMTDDFDQKPILSSLFVAQPVLLYFFLRIRYAIELPLMWCCTCTEHRHLQYHLFSACFAGFLIFCNVYSMIRSMIGEGLLQFSKVLFVVQIFSLLAAISVFVIIWKFPRLILSDRAMA